MNYKFVLVDSASGNELSQWILTPPVTVGRCPTAEITIGDASISRKHCQFLVDPYDSLVVRDLGSKNGVYVDERRVERAVVRPGTPIRIGLVTDVLALRVPAPRRLGGGAPLHWLATRLRRRAGAPPAGLVETSRTGT